MLLGLSLVIVSVSFLAYRHPPSSWTPFRSFPVNRDRQESNANDRIRRHEPEKKSSARADGAKIGSDGDNLGERAEQKSADSPNTTPKAKPIAGEAPNNTLSGVPTFSLDNDDDDYYDSMPPPSFAAANSTQRASSGSDPTAWLKPSSPTSPASIPKSVLMPPPQLPKARTVRNAPLLPITPGSLRVPSSGPLPNRSPTAGSNSLAAPITAPLKVPNPRQKVELKPGYSPLDWARLQKSGANLSGVGSLQRVKPSRLKYYNGRKGRPAWSVWQGKVYNITPYLPFHPGGKGELRRAAGKNGEKLFMEVHPWVNWENMLGDCMVGILVGENDGMEEDGNSNLDSID